MGSGENVGTDECEFRHVAKEMWTNFARTGNPSTDKYQWKKYRIIIAFCSVHAKRKEKQ